MAGGVNKVILIGNLGKDPEVRHLENGTAVANFPIATSESYKEEASPIQETMAAGKGPFEETGLEVGVKIQHSDEKEY